jgi:hypothetical protein
VNENPSIFMYLLLISISYHCHLNMLGWRYGSTI